MTTIITALGIVAAMVLLFVIFNICRVSGMCSRAEELRQMEEASKPKVTGEM